MNSSKELEWRPQAAEALSPAGARGLACIHSGPRHKLYRFETAGGEVVVKTSAIEPPSERTNASLHREYELVRKLGAPGVVQVLGISDVGAGLGIQMSCAGRSNLAERIQAGALSISDFLHIAIQLAETIARLHGANIVHRDINPGNVVWDATSRRATLCDFAQAISFPELLTERGAALSDSTLTYVSPEQTGRTGRSVDFRTDLYSLGVTFYEMLVGRPPFAMQDAIELAHAHIARRPEAPHELRADIPPAVSQLVLKLLEKEPERRYQTADALAIDLREAQARWSGTGAIDLFALASHDVPRELKIPEKLYGRDAEVRTLAAAFTRARRGGRELVLITGAPGIGKSALVNQLGRSVAEHGGFFIAGKFDQLQRSVPFSGLAQAFQMLVRQLLIEPEPVLTAWRGRIQEAVAPNGQLLVDLVPELERILGPQARLGEAGPVEAKNRFSRVMTRFITTIADHEHPLALFLDDVQWMDPASLELLGRWWFDDSIHHLLLIGAYRDGEVDPAHPLRLSLAEWREAAGAVHEIHLKPLVLDDIARLAVDAFKSDPAQTQVLAEMILRKTAGNPFFARRLLLLLHAQGLIRFLPQARRWQWDARELESAPIADSVVELMMHAIDRLPAPTRMLLRIAACIGHRFDLDTLSEVSGLTSDDAAQTLQPALEDGLLVRARDARAARPAGAPSVTDPETPAATLQFSHDRVQQAAYAMSGEQRRRELHLEIGRRLLRNAGDAQLDSQLFDVVDQLDLGVSLIEDPAERLRLAELNLAAGRKAQGSAAYRAACEYLSVGMRLLADDRWNVRPDLTFALHRELSECAYLTGQHAMAEELIDAALTHAPSSVARADLHSLRVLAATVVGDWAAALRWGREGLAVFGQAWPLEGLAQANEVEAKAVVAHLGSRRIEALLDEPQVQDAETRAVMRLLSLLGPPAYFSGADVLTFLVTRATNLSLLHGPSAYSAYAYVFHGALHNARTGEYDVGYAFGTLALALARRFADRAEESRVLEVFGLVVHGWKAPLRASLPLLREGYRAGVESGELAYAAFNLNSILINGLPAGVPLADLLSDAEVAIEFAGRHSNRTSIEIALPLRQFARSLMGTTRAAGHFDDEDFQEARFLEDARGNGTALGNFWVARLQSAYLFGDLETARRSSREGERHVVAGILGMMPSAEHVFYTALTWAAEATNASVESRQAARDAMAALQARLVEWAGHCPDNFAHKVALVDAEMARLAGESSEAARLYRVAIDGAAKRAFVQDEALAHELRARFFVGEPELAAVHFRAARDGYRQWGAARKARALEIEQPACFASETHTVSRPASIDALALIKASQAISAETVPEALFERILRVLAEVAGARRGAVVLCEDDELRVRARIEMQAEGAVSLEATPLDECADLPAGIIRYVVRMQEALVLVDAAAAQAFAADPAVRARHVRSVLCVPLKQQAKVVGLLYLDNDALAGAFADGLVEIVQVLAAQAVISLENAHLHQASRQELEQRKQAQLALSEANRRKDEFLAMLAHELRNPLAPIAAAADLLQRPDVDATRVEQASAVIARQVRHMTGLVDDLLDVSRVTRGLVNLEQATLDVYPTVLDAIEQVRPLIEARHHELALRASPVPALVRADPKRLLQVLTNLLTNAAKYTPWGGRISVELAVADDQVRIDVTDTGQGMSAELVANCFELFVQAERTSERAAGGLGIGLALVKSLVVLQGGSVQAHSEGAGQGSRFTVSLPQVRREDAPAAAVAPVALEPSGPVGRLKVLIVDDNEDAAGMLAWLVEALGHEPIVEHHPARALKLLEHDRPDIRPDICLLDIGLPDIDGYELARRIRAMFGQTPVELIAVTGYGQPQDRENALAAGFNEHFTKPLDSGKLAELLSRLSRPAARAD